MVDGIVARKKFVYLCTNALLMEKKLDQYKPSPYFVWSVHLDGDREMHDHSVCQDGVYDKALAAVRKAKERGFRISMNCTLFSNADPERVAKFFDSVKGLGIDGITVSPGYAYERAPDQEHFLNRTRTKQLFRDIFRKRPRRAQLVVQPVEPVPRLPRRQPGISLHAVGQSDAQRVRLAAALLSAWARAMSARFKELMEETDWDSYGTGNYEKCADCMVHCGYEATAVMDAVTHPLKALKIALRGVETEKPMAPEIALDRQRPAQYVFENHVEKKLAEIGETKAARKVAVGAG